MRPTIWHKIHEASAFSQYKASLPNELIVHESGIFISQQGFLAASPDGIVTSVNNSKEGYCGVIEIKCPYSCRFLSVREACSRKGFFCELVNDEIHLRRNHHYFYQIQGSMAVVGVEWCDFIVWTTKDLTIERIKFDSTFWRDKFKLLHSAYISYILPEIIYPKINLQLDLPYPKAEPNSIMTADPEP